MNIGIPKETDPVESRSAIIPGNVKRLVALGATVQIETGAGDGSGFSEEAFTADGAIFVQDRQSLLGAADIVLHVRKPPLAEVDWMRPGSVQVSFLDPFKETELVAKLARKGISAVSLEMLPRITRAQKMDALTSQASLAGRHGNPGISPCPPQDNDKRREYAPKIRLHGLQSYYKQKKQKE